MKGDKGDAGYPGIGLPGWVGEKVNFDIFFNLLKTCN